MSPRCWIKVKIRGDLPRAGLDADAEPIGQGARNVVDPAATGDVREGQHVPAIGTQRATQHANLVEVGPMWLEESLADDQLLTRHGASPLGLGQDAARQRVAVGMQAAGGQPQ